MQQFQQNKIRSAYKIKICIKLCRCFVYDSFDIPAWAGK